ncbi:hypothetical protein [Streptomyces diastatochromogenes]|uniref:hypothetical protein n=1 Tax=Streptomyces diastatochromogenes TaxID=42236 RepID=UPI0036BBD434
MRAYRGCLAAATVLAALATMAAQCGDGQGGSAPGGGQGGGRPAASARSTPPSHGGKPPSGKPSPKQRATTPPDPYTGLVSVTDMRPPLEADGSHQVSCSALDSQFTVTPYHAGARWRAVALDYSPPSSQRQYSTGNIARDVVIQPSSGTLELGQSVTVHVSGRYDGEMNPADFWIIIQAPDPNWSTRVVQHFHCIGR